jgi:hypothetical protein
VIIQKVIKGITDLRENDAKGLLAAGITCRWWQKVNPLPNKEIPQRLTDRNLEWHQNRYDDPDPTENNEVFGAHTPFISTTAGTVDRDEAYRRNVIYPAWQVALEFATNGWQQDGWLFYCYLFVLGRRSVRHQGFSEEIRELNVYTGFSLFQPEGEIVAKIIIPPAQIEKCEWYEIAEVSNALDNGRRPRPSRTERNPLYYVPPERIANIRDVLL